MKETQNLQFKTEISNSILIVSLQSEVDLDAAEGFSNDIQDQIKNSPQIEKVVLNFHNKFSIDFKAIRAIGPMGVELRKQKKSLYFIGASKNVKNFMRDMGLNSLLKFYDSLEDVITDRIPTELDHSKKLNVDFVNPFISGAIETLKVQCFMDCHPLKTILKENLVDPQPCDIAGVIGITSPQFTGSIAICFPKKVFLGAMSQMLGESYTDITKDLEDGAGELLNIIFGYAKKILNERAFAIEKAIPTIVRGTSLEIKHITNSKTIVVPFETTFGLFYIEIGIEAFS
ncbi:chemotaxis protein CheX [Pseudobdellovibrio exovorus]|uniref:STAS domain-containing protein n=1 Tax=Pseudobdellovibrio exovorus JSS TaxID=1184267 RepID=M4V5T1_9BACT|nr:chemotaxis protein CheX [Pseudobdellovibrio exovorus]AGH94523.1 hypothetical protein A11Q_303 [Pseudobdellovibrio exovorus JSS]